LSKLKTTVLARKSLHCNSRTASRKKVIQS